MSGGQDMWGGRFAAKPSDIMKDINASIDVDKRLWRQDIEGSLAHASMLTKQGILSEKDGADIAKGLNAIAAEIEAGQFVFSKDLEDIHLNIEARLTERIGEAGKRLHTGRSRNDQVATDFKLWVTGAADEAEADIKALMRALISKAEQHYDWVMPGFTHLQTAQPVTLGHHLLAYVEMLDRDRLRMAMVAGRTRNSGCPLGAAALAGTVYPIDREQTAQALGFSRPMANSLDAVASRDFAFDLLSALSISLTQASRLAEEIVLWTSPQFGFARLSDGWSTGSSIMPQKRNPDAAELIRAKASQVSANFAALLGIVKALPLAYAKDLQDDKRLTFEAFDAWALCFAALRGMIETISFQRDVMRAAATRGYSTATDLADWLVRALNMPFREAHHVTGAVVKRAESLGITELSALPLADFQAIEPRINGQALAALTVEASVSARNSYGGTAPAQVLAQIVRWQAEIATWERA
jgi:argininosuccinate lyase